jgi:hypothetical protein
MAGVRLDIFTKQSTPRTERQAPGRDATLLRELVAVLAIVIAILLFSFW